MRNALWVLVLAGAASQTFAQTTTSTTNANCNVNGNSANCTSNTTTVDQSAQQRQNAEAGARAGQALGAGIAVAMQRHNFSKGLRKYCDAHPGETWHYYSGLDGHIISSGNCPSDADKVNAAVNEFLAHHKE